MELGILCISWCYASRKYKSFIKFASSLSVLSRASSGIFKFDDVNYGGSWQFCGFKVV
jgi:hypothetical protein